jgi:hypothetical protein
MQFDQWDTFNKPTGNRKSYIEKRLLNKYKNITYLMRLNEMDN